MSSGSLQTPTGDVPVLLVHAAERGDPSGLILAQRFVSDHDTVYAEPEGQIDKVQVQQNHFRHVPFRISPDSTQNVILLQESFVRFAKRMMTQAFHDQDPRVLSVSLTAVDEVDEADASFNYVHQDSQTHLKATLVYRKPLQTTHTQNVVLQFVLFIERSLSKLNRPTPLKFTFDSLKNDQNR